jgi:quercetin dioxygenase-like cupin family protein
MSVIQEACMGALEPAHREALSPVGLALFFVVAATPLHGQNERKTAADSQSDAFSLATARWSEPYNGPLGFPKGAQRATLSIDSSTGGETYYAHFPTGSRFQLHWHAYPEYAVVLRGTVTHTLGQDRRTLSPGDYVVIPAKVNHGWEVPANGSDAFLLIRRSGPADFNFVER